MTSLIHLDLLCYILGYHYTAAVVSLQHPTSRDVGAMKFMAAIADR